MAPRLWVGATTRKFWPLFGQIAAYTLIASLYLGFMAGGAFSQWLHEEGTNFDDKWSSFIIGADGTLRVEGDRPYRKEFQGLLVALDPGGGMDTGQIAADNYILVRDQVIVQGNPMMDRATSLSLYTRELQQDLRVDGEALMRVSREYSLTFRILGLVFMGCFFTMTGLLSAVPYAALAALFVHAFLGRIKHLNYGQCFRIALAAVSGKLFIEALITPFLGYQFAFPVYMIVTVCLTFFALSYIRVDVEPGRDHSSTEGPRP